MRYAPEAIHSDDLTCPTYRRRFIWIEDEIFMEYTDTDIIRQYILLLFRWWKEFTLLKWLDKIIGNENWYFWDVKEMHRLNQPSEEIFKIGFVKTCTRRTFFRLARAIILLPVHLYSKPKQLITLPRYVITAELIKGGIMKYWGTYSSERTEVYWIITHWPHGLSSLKQGRYITCASVEYSALWRMAESSASEMRPHKMTIFAVRSRTAHHETGRE